MSEHGTVDRGSEESSREIERTDLHKHFVRSRVAESRAGKGAACYAWPLGIDCKHQTVTIGSALRRWTCTGEHVADSTITVIAQQSMDDVTDVVCLLHGPILVWTHLHVSQGQSCRGWRTTGTDQPQICIDRTCKCMIHPPRMQTSHGGAGHAEELHQNSIAPCGTAMQEHPRYTYTCMYTAHRLAVPRQ